MKKIKILFFSFIAGFMMLMLGACGEKTPQPTSIPTTEIPTTSEHIHDYGTVYYKDATNHWKECSCGEKGNLSEHSYGNWITITEATEETLGSKKQVCATCSYENIVEIPKLDHVHKYVDEVIEPTCEDDGYTKHSCKCGDTYTDTIVKTSGHNIIQYGYLAPTCTEVGHNAYEKCNKCDYTTYEEIKAKGHTEVIDKAVLPTCKEPGLTQGSHCGLCGDVIVAQQIVSAKGHTEVIDKEVSPTCTETGLTEGSHCGLCGDIIAAQQVIAAKGHTYNRVVYDPTCEEQGYTKYTCKCGDTYKDNYTTALGHTKVIDEAVAATCTEPGLTEGSHCGVCSVVIIAQEIVVMDHYFEEQLCKYCDRDVNGNILKYTLLDDETYSVNMTVALNSEHVIIPNQYKGIVVTSIETNAFKDSTLISITIGSNIRNICSGAFYNSSLEKIYYRGTIEDWCNIKFANKSANPMSCASSFNMLDEKNEWYEVTNIVIPNTIKSIGGYQFSGFNNLTGIIISYGATSIGYDAFSECSNLEGITIPSSVTSITSWAFSGCSSLKDIYYTGTIEEWCNILFDSYSNPMEYASHFYIFDNQNGWYEVTNLIIPNTITSIGYNQFSGFDNLTSISIPYGIQSIEGSSFSGCSSLTSIIIPDSVTWMGQGIFSGCINLKSITIPFLGDTKDGTGERFAHYMFNYATSYVEEVIITGGNIKYSAFKNYESLRSVTLGDSVTTIPNEAFSNCVNLTTIVIGSNMTDIYNKAFDSCPNLKNVYYNGTSASWSDIYIASYNSALTSAKIYYYSKTHPTTSGYYWHYDTNGNPVVWDAIQYSTPKIYAVDLMGDDLVNTTYNDDEVVTVIQNDEVTITVEGSNSKLMVTDARNDSVAHAHDGVIYNTRLQVNSSKSAVKITAVKSGKLTLLGSGQNEYLERAFVLTDPDGNAYESVLQFATDDTLSVNTFDIEAGVTYTITSSLFGINIYAFIFEFVGD